nr:phospholipid carrier-dependent glycosyltransferase [Actinoplanes sp. RD1]
MAAAMIVTAVQQTPTIDEPVYVGTAVTYLEQHSLRYNPEHPPLGKLIMAAGLVFAHPHLDPAFRGNQTELGRHVLYEAGNDPDEMMFLARLPLILLTLLFGLVVFAFARDLTNAVGGLLALALYAFSPDVITHGSLATLDVPAIGFLLTAVWLTWRARTARPWLHLALAGATLGAALATRMSVLPAVPVVLLLAALAIIRVRRPGTSDQASAAPPEDVASASAPAPGAASPLAAAGRQPTDPGERSSRAPRSPGRSAAPTPAQAAAPTFARSAAPTPARGAAPTPARNAAPIPGRGAAPTPARGAAPTLARAVGAALGVAAVAVGVVWLTYLIVDPRLRFLEPLGMPEIHGVRALLVDLLPFPEPYRDGMRIQFGFEDSTFSGFLFGRLYEGSLWYYLPAALLVKTPLAMLVLWLGATGAMLAVPRLRPAIPYVLVPPALLLAIAMTGARDFGTRYAIFMPIFLAVAAAGVVLVRWRWAPPVAGVLAALVAVSSLSTFPYYLPYSNEAFGGTARTHLNLHDSNVDWGQDLGRLADHLRTDYPGEPVWLIYKGAGLPSAYGIKARNPLEVPADEVHGLLVVSDSSVAKATGRLAALLATSGAPIDDVGHSISIYRRP